MDYTEMTLGELVSHANEIVKRNAMSILKQLQRGAEVKQECFKITSVARADLEEAGFDTRKVEDATMRRLASKMAEAYCENSFWIDLKILAECLSIPKKKD